MITLGTFGAFYKCLDSRVKQAIVQELNMPSNFDSASLLGDIIFTLKDLRNAVAHNGIVVDVRFKSNSVNQGIGKLLNGDSNITGINFNEIIYVFLTIFLYLLKCPQSLILSALRAFCFCGKPRISRSIFLYFPCQSWLKSW